MSESLDVPLSRCRKCNEPLERARPMEDGTVPGEGDISMCVYCGLISIYNADQTLREPTFEEWDKITNQEKVKDVLRNRSYWRRKILGRTRD
jgi:hypothetical protein